jgi:hypothetical protein
MHDTTYSTLLFIAPTLGLCASFLVSTLERAGQGGDVATGCTIRMVATVAQSILPQVYHNIFDSAASRPQRSTV